MGATSEYTILTNKTESKNDNGLNFPKESISGGHSASNETKTEMLSRIRNQHLQEKGSSPNRNFNPKTSQVSSNSVITQEMNMKFNIQHSKKRGVVNVGK